MSAGHSEQPPASFNKYLCTGLDMFVKSGRCLVHLKKALCFLQVDLWAITICKNPILWLAIYLRDVTLDCDWGARGAHFLWHGSALDAKSGRKAAASSRDDAE